VRSQTRRRSLPAGSGLLLIPAAAFLVHQLRYSLTYGSHTRSALAAQGHNYLHSLVPWVVLTLGIGLSSFLRRAARAARSGDAGALARVGVPMLWLITTLGLIAIYVVQESLEELLTWGHPNGIGGIVGHGGWRAVPVAAVVAIGVVALLRLGRAVLRLAETLAPASAAARARSLRRPAAVLLVAPPPLARAGAGRAPPSA
jgi:hypothetical protein